MPSLPTFAKKYPIKIFIWYLGNWKCILYVTIFILICGMHIQYYDTAPMTLQGYIWWHVTNKIYPFNCWNDSVMYEKSCPQLVINIPFSIEKCIVVCQLISLPYNLTSCIPIKSNLCLSNSPATDLIVPTHPKYQILCTFSIA
jgi:hypothetical protein